MKFIFKSRSLALKSMVTYCCWWNLRPIRWSEWDNIIVHVHNTFPLQPYLDLKYISIGFEECNERLIRVNYCHNQTVGFRERCGQNLVKVGQTQSNLINGPESTRLNEIQIQILIIEIEEYGDILVLLKFKTKWMVRLKEHSHTGTQLMSITSHT